MSEPYFERNECDVCHEHNWVCPCGIKTCNARCARCDVPAPSSPVWRVVVEAYPRPEKVEALFYPAMHRLVGEFLVTADSVGEAFATLDREFDLDGLNIVRTTAYPAPALAVSISNFRPVRIDECP